MKNYIFIFFVVFSCFITFASNEEKSESVLNILKNLQDAAARNGATITGITTDAIKVKSALETKTNDLSNAATQSADAATSIQEIQEQSAAKAKDLQISHDREVEYEKEYWRRKKCRDGCKVGCWGQLIICCCDDSCFDECEEADQKKYLMHPEGQTKKNKPNACCLCCQKIRGNHEIQNKETDGNSSCCKKSKGCPCRQMKR